MKTYTTTQLYSFPTKYSTIYQRLIKRAQTRSFNEIYKERHHIVPKCLGGSDDESNLVNLTPEEHYIAHQILVKLFPQQSDERCKLLRSAYCMSKLRYRQPGRSKNKMYGWLQREYNLTRRKRSKMICEHCGKEYECYTHTLTKYKHHYCSKECHYNARRQKSNAIEVTCEHCGKIFTCWPGRPKRFCSRDCVYKFRSNRPVNEW